MADLNRADKMRFVQIGDLRHDLHLSIFPSLVSDRRSEPIINLIVIECDALKVNNNPNPWTENSQRCDQLSVHVIGK